MTVLFFILLCLIWGSTWMAIKINLGTFPPFYSAGFRFLLAGVLLLLFTTLKKIKFDEKAGSYGPAMVFGVLNGAAYGLVYWGEQFISSGLTAVLNASLPFFSMIFAFLFVNEKITFKKVGGSIIGFGGVILLFYEGLTGSESGRLPGELAIIFSAAVYAYAGVYMKKRSGIHPLKAVTIQMFFSAAVLLTAAVVIERKVPLHFEIQAVLAFLYLSVVGSAIAFYLYNELILRMEVSNLSYVSMITPAIATMLGVVWLGEHVQWETIIGMLLILSGTALINIRRTGSGEEINTLDQKG